MCGAIACLLQLFKSPSQGGPHYKAFFFKPLGGAKEMTVYVHLFCKKQRETVAKNTFCSFYNKSRFEFSIVALCAYLPDLPADWEFWKFSELHQIGDDCNKKH